MPPLLTSRESARFSSKQQRFQRIRRAAHALLTARRRREMGCLGAGDGAGDMCHAPSGKTPEVIFFQH
jgi:hypothetical protein